MYMQCRERSGGKRDKISDSLAEISNARHRARPGQARKRVRIDFVAGVSKGKTDGARESI